MPLKEGSPARVALRRYAEGAMAADRPECQERDMVFAKILDELVQDHATRTVERRIAVAVVSGMFTVVVALTSWAIARSEQVATNTIMLTETLRRLERIEARVDLIGSRAEAARRAPRTEVQQ